MKFIKKYINFLPWLVLVSILVTHLINGLSNGKYVNDILALLLVCGLAIVYNFHRRRLNKKELLSLLEKSDSQIIITSINENYTKSPFGGIMSYFAKVNGKESRKVFADTMLTIEQSDSIQFFRNEKPISAVFLNLESGVYKVVDAHSISSFMSFSYGVLLFVIVISKSFYTIVIGSLLMLIFIFWYFYNQKIDLVKINREDLERL